MRRDIVQRRKKVAIHRRSLRLQVAIALSVVGQVEIRPQRHPYRIGPALRRNGQQGVHGSFELLTLRDNRLTGRDDRGDERCLL